MTTILLTVIAIETIVIIILYMIICLGENNYFEKLYFDLKPKYDSLKLDHEESSKRLWDAKDDWRHLRRIVTEMESRFEEEFGKKQAAKLIANLYLK